MSKNEALKTILIAAPEKQKGKSQLAVNLALSLAFGGKTVILVDTDLRIPGIHALLEIPNEKGLSDVLTDQATVEEVTVSLHEGKLKVITAGSHLANVVEHLDTPKMDETLSKLKEIADIVILDSPPFFVADSSILASKADGLLAIIRPSFSKKAAVISMANQINRSHARLLGIVLDGIPSWGSAYFSKVINNRYFAS